MGFYKVVSTRHDKAGPGLAFITYPKAVIQMQLSPLWAALFFFVIFLVGIDSQFADVKGVLTNIIDTFPKRLNTTKRRMILAAVYCGITFVIGLSMVSKGIVLFRIISFKPLVYHRIYVDPDWAQIFGVILALSSMLCVPVVVVVKMIQARGSLYERFKYTTSPLLESYQLPESWKTKSRTNELPECDVQEDAVPLTNDKTTVC